MGIFPIYPPKIRRPPRRLPTKRQTVMKKKNLLLLAPITLSAALFLGYRAWDGLRTDKTPPQISVSEETLEVSVSAPKSTLLQGVTAKDDRDGDVTGSLVVERISASGSGGAIEVSIAAFDASGNVAKTVRTARYTDYRSPRFGLNCSPTFTYGSNFDLLSVVTATDDLDGNIQHRIRATSLDNAPVTNIGSHEVEFRVTNSLGDTVRLTIPVTIYAADTYGLDVELTGYMAYLKTGGDFDADSYLKQVSRGLNTVSLQNGIPAGYSVRISGDVKTAVPGVYPVDYTVTYVQPTNDGTQYISGISRLIVVVEE